MTTYTQNDTDYEVIVPSRQAKTTASLAIDTFKAFRPYINVYDPGIKTLDSCCPLTNDLIFKPVHMIPKIVWELNTEYKCQKARGVLSPHVVHPNGNVFRPFDDMVAKILSEKHCERALRGEDTYYYTSGKELLGMLYLDIDAHFQFQTDEDRASKLVRAAFPFAFHAPSGRGTNELLKVAHAGEITRFNELAIRLQAAMRKVFNGAKILCDFEVKGTITAKKSGSLAKLPWNRRWNYGRLEEFKACETITLMRLESIIFALEQNADDAEWAGKRHSLKKAETEALRQAVEAVTSSRKAAVTVPVSATKVMLPATPAPTPVSCSATPSASATTQPSRTTDCEIANDNPDRLRANIALARLYAQQIKRVPTLDEFLSFLKANGFYTGSWDQTLSARRDRCEYVLRVFVAKHWDASKLRNAARITSMEIDQTPHQDASKLRNAARIKVNIDKWNSFCKQFPEEWVESLNCKGIVKRFHLTREDAKAYFAINWTLLNDHPNADRSVPFTAIRAFWQELYATGRTSARPTDDKIAALRAVFDIRGIIKITDPNYSPLLKKAIRYELGPNAPGQSDYWKTKGQVPAKVTTGEISTLPSTTHTHITLIGRHVAVVVPLWTLPPHRAGP